MHAVEEHKSEKAEFKQDTFSTDIQYSIIRSLSPRGYDFCGKYFWKVVQQLPTPITPSNTFVFCNKGDFGTS
jgi:hypothetical protein